MPEVTTTPLLEVVSGGKTTTVTVTMAPITIELVAALSKNEVALQPSLILRTQKEVLSTLQLLQQ